MTTETQSINTTEPEKTERDDPVRIVCQIVENELRELEEWLLEESKARAEMTADGDVSYFGGCPECHGVDLTLSPHGNHWMICRRHLTTWRVGWNLFSAWKEQSEADHLRAQLYLMAFETVEPYHAPREPAMEVEAGEPF